MTFDLACDIDGSLWHPVTAIGSYDRATKQFAPRIAFPWTPRAMVYHWRSQGDVVDAPAGSVIKVAHLRSLPMYPTFQDLDVEEHRERKVAYLWVFQPDGEVKLAEPPLMLLAETATIAHAEIGTTTGRTPAWSPSSNGSWRPRTSRIAFPATSPNGRARRSRCL